MIDAYRGVVGLPAIPGAEPVGWFRLRVRQPSAWRAGLRIHPGIGDRWKRGVVSGFLGQYRGARPGWL